MGSSVVSFCGYNSEYVVYHWGSVWAESAVVSCADGALYGKYVARSASEGAVAYVLFDASF